MDYFKNKFLKINLCLFSALNVVRLGELDYSNTADDAQTQEFDIHLNNIMPHPNYRNQKVHFDMALVELNRPAILNKYVAPACLALTNGNEFEQFTAIGLGSTSNAGKPSSHLLKVQLQRFSNDKCSEVTKNSSEKYNNQTQICAGSNVDNADTCQGDSGGPLFTQHPTYGCMHLIVGVTSYSTNGCGAMGVPAIYSRIHLFIDWIEQVVWNATRFA